MERRRERFVGVFFQGMIDVRVGPLPNSTIRKYGDRIGDQRPANANVRPGQMLDS